MRLIKNIPATELNTGINHNINYILELYYD